jgi:hypothetical protein
MVLPVVLLAGCASCPGQVSKTRYLPLPEIEPAAIPKPSGQDVASVVSGVVPVLGDIVIGKGLNPVMRSRDFLYWSDPSEFLTLDYTRTAISGPRARGILQPTGPSLEREVGVELSTGEHGIPIGGGELKISLSANQDLALKNLRLVEIDLTDFDYLGELTNVVSGDEQVYFVSGVVAGDINIRDAAGLSLKFVPGPDSEFKTAPALQAAYERTYGGLGLIVGVELQAVEYGASISTKALSPESIARFQSASKKIFNTTSSVDRESFTWNPTDEGVELVFWSPNFGSKNGLIFDARATAPIVGRKIDLKAGRHDLTFIDRSANSVYGVRTVVRVAKPGAGFEAFELSGSREVRVLSWRGVTKDSLSTVSPVASSATPAVADVAVPPTEPVVFVGSKEVTSDTVIRAPRVVFKDGSSVRVRNGARFEIHSSEILVEGSATIDGNGEKGSTGAQGGDAPNLVHGAVWEANHNDYTKAKNDLLGNREHPDRGRQGQPGGPGGSGATVILSQRHPHLTVVVGGGPGGDGGPPGRSRTLRCNEHNPCDGGVVDANNGHGPQGPNGPAGVILYLDD